MRRDLAQGRSACEPPGALHVYGEVFVTKLEPSFPAQLPESFHERPALLASPPTPDRIGQSGECIHDGIQIGCDTQAQVLKIIARVDDDRQLFGRERQCEAVCELGATHTAAQRHDVTCHRKRSCCWGRMRAAAG